MDQKSLIDALSECSNTCGWCLEYCPDIDKYEILETCIGIQIEFLEVGKVTNKILAGGSAEFMKITFDLFEKIAKDIQQKQSNLNHKKYMLNANSNSAWKLPGCSQIFSVAQSLRDIYVNDSLRFDAD